MADRKSRCGGGEQRGADLLIAADGNVAAAKYGVHAYGQWSVDELLELASGFGRGTGT